MLRMDQRGARKKGEDNWKALGVVRAGEKGGGLLHSGDSRDGRRGQSEISTGVKKGQELRMAWRPALKDTQRRTPRFLA